jgi:hypothetical protein
MYAKIIIAPNKSLKYPLKKYSILLKWMFLINNILKIAKIIENRIILILNPINELLNLIFIIFHFNLILTSPDF